MSFGNHLSSFTSSVLTHVRNAGWSWDFSGGASWNRTSDLSIIREIRQISLTPSCVSQRADLAAHRPIAIMRVRRTGIRGDRLGPHCWDKVEADSMSYRGLSIGIFTFMATLCTCVSQCCGCPNTACTELDETQSRTTRLVKGKPKA